MTTGRYPFNSAYGYRGKLAQVHYVELGGIYEDLPYNTSTMWGTWFFGADGILGTGVLKRWSGTAWIICNKIKVHPF